MPHQIIWWLSCFGEQAFQLFLYTNGGLERKLVHVGYNVERNLGDSNGLGELGLQGCRVLLVSLLVLAFYVHGVFNH